MRDALDLEVRDRAPGDVGDGHADADGEHERPEDDALAMLGASEIVRPGRCFITWPTVNSST